MIYQIELHPEVLSELEESYRWYEERSEGLGLRFIGSINKRISEIAKDPEIYTKSKAGIAKH